MSFLARYMSATHVDVYTPGTGFCEACLNCSQKQGEPHLAGCEFITGEDDPTTHGGILGASVADCWHGMQNERAMREAFIAANPLGTRRAYYDWLRARFEAHRTGYSA